MKASEEQGQSLKEAEEVISLELMLKAEESA